MDINTDQTPPRAPVGNLTDFAEGCTEDNPLYVEVSLNEDGRVVVFHDKPFRTEVSWFEYDLGTSKLDFVMDGGEIRNIGMALHPTIAKHMHNTHQILTVLMDDKTGEAINGHYIPLILHRS